MEIHSEKRRFGVENSDVGRLGGKLLVGLLLLGTIVMELHLTATGK